MMTIRWSGASLREFQTLISQGAISAMTDRQLLDRFVENRDEAAFAGLIERHESMVWGVCRRVLNDPADAGDAFQATFLVLVRRAGSVRVDDSLGPWLYGVSTRVAKRARVVALRRRERERTNSDLPELPSPAAGSQADLRPLIDEALQRLPPRYRSAIVLCYLEGLTHEEAARRLSCPVGTVRSRLARGRSLLRARLERQGLAPNATILASALLPAPGRPGPLLTSTAQAAARLAAGRSLSGIVPASVETLVAGITRTLLMTKIGLIASFLAVPLIGIATLANQGADPPSPAIERQKAAPHRNEPTSEAELTVAAVLSSNQEPANADTQPEVFEDFPAVVVKTVPPAVTTDVDPGLSEIQVTFSKKMMDKGWSWVQHSKATFPEVKGKPSYTKDKRTCRLPVKLEPGKTYAIWVNSPRFGNFKDAAGQSAAPFLLLFHTKDAHTK